MKTVIKYLGTVAAVLLTVELVPGVSVSGAALGAPWMTVLLVALVWSVITMIIRPVLRLLTLPITIITFGIFSLILNALLFWAVTIIVPGFSIDGFLSALLGVIVLSLLNWAIQKVL